MGVVKKRSSSTGKLEVTSSSSRSGKLPGRGIKKEVKDVNIIAKGVLDEFERRDAARDAKKKK